MTLTLIHPDFPGEVWTDAEDAHAPEDHVGGPYKISLVLYDGDDDDPWHLIGEPVGNSYRWAAVQSPDIYGALDALGDERWFTVVALSTTKVTRIGPGAAYQCVWTAFPLVISLGLRSIHETTFYHNPILRSDPGA